MASIKEEQNMISRFRIIDETSLEEDIRCKMCKLYLNVPPIKFHKEIGNVCGRCNNRMSSNRSGTHQCAYEDLSKNFTWPCNNEENGCDTILKMGEVVDHEKACRFNNIMCPLFHLDHCPWFGILDKLNIHLKIHTIVANPWQFEYEKEKNYISLTTVENQFCIVNMKHDKNKCMFRVILCETYLENQDFQYELEFSDKDESNSFIMRKGHLEAIENNWKETWSGKSFKIDTNKIAAMLKNPKKIRVKVTILKKNNIELMQIRGLTEDEMQASGSQDSTSSMQVSNENTPDHEILAALKCPVCNEFMIPPIPICPSGHSLCSECKTKVPNCSLCTKTFEDGRNFTLEKLTQNVKYPCNNREIGCSFVTTSDKIKQHQSDCEFQNPCIIVQCGWKGLSAGLYHHFLENHREYIIENNTFVVKYTTDENSWQHFLFVMGEIFCLTYKHSGRKSRATFNIQHVGQLEAQPKFKYSITFSPSPDDQPTNLIITHGCKKWRSNSAQHLTVIIPEELFNKQVYYYIKIYITPI